ncbi:transglutaminase-like cysteine peptidase [Sulfuritalea sp.]|uniref:transglutaminase-like cysteine peptidase n=1 Tax=Sulfuritalea sp. TaxID=2480090 RepID=UPI00286E1DFE|nr:transglutaminase-like cysteine peptidase [Sulfuritalea sp.]
MSRFHYVWRCLLLALAVSVVQAYDFDRLQRLLGERFGPARVAFLRDWQQTLAETRSRSMPEKDKLVRINDFINRNIGFEDDLSIWNQSDYWATPLETIGQGRGDCEDFSIIKYYSLKDAGVPVAKLRLVYVKARLEGPAGPYLQAHMVLAYYPTPNAEPLVLDNLVPEIRPASQRKDLQPVFSFNSEAIWSGVAGNAAKGAGGTGQLSRWQDLLQRARGEGFD